MDEESAAATEQIYLSNCTMGRPCTKSEDINKGVAGENHGVNTQLNVWDQKSTARGYQGCCGCFKILINGFDAGRNAMCETKHSTPIFYLPQKEKKRYSK